MRTDEQIAKNRVYKAEYRRAHSDRIKASKRKWERSNPESSKNRKNRFRFGGNRDLVLKRDNYSCVKCGMTDAEHRTRYGRGITVDHIDGKGRYSKTPNSTLENLQTLCLPCHGNKDSQWNKLNVIVRSFVTGGPANSAPEGI